jgi:hypothetical protein
MKKLKTLPKFKNEDEERDFWATHTFLDYYDIKKFKQVPPPMVPKTKDVILHQVLADMNDQVEKLSKKKKLSIEEMVRQLVAAGLKQQGLQPRV